MVQEGMFLDGVTYSAISKNLANGYGSFWEPHYTKTLFTSFHEHPPLVFIIESYFFKLFGNAFYTERIFSLATALLTAFGIIKCWKLLSDPSEIKINYWLPILIWLSVPLVSWSYKNNMLENTMGVFTIFSVYFILKALIDQGKRIIN
ncbi:MAG: glycosyltransferase family 39 protein [Polaribacter sp.]